ncbi:MAG TPA: hypothetical protein VJ488_03830, partial [Dehalococcoidia bacterium]|nr:hypothetical protein [Dehalococcoidia bacterium]
QSYQRARKDAGKNDLFNMYLLLLVYGMGLGALQEMHQRLNFPKAEYDLMVNTLRLKAQMERLARPKLKPFAIYRMLQNYPPAAIQANFLANPAPLIQSRLSLYLRKWSCLKPLLKGNDLIAAGITKGPQIKAVLDSLLEARINGEISNKAEGQRLLQELMRNKNTASARG